MECRVLARLLKLLHDVFMFLPLQDLRPHQYVVSARLDFPSRKNVYRWLRLSNNATEHRMFISAQLRFKNVVQLRHGSGSLNATAQGAYLRLFGSAFQTTELRGDVSVSQNCWAILYGCLLRAGLLKRRHHYGMFPSLKCHPVHVYVRFCWARLSKNGISSTHVCFSSSFP
jgi:hypothetical protein